MELRFIVCAQSVTVDQRHNTLSLFHLVEEWSIPSFPFVMPPTTLIGLFERTLDEPNEPDRIEVVIRFGDRELIRKKLTTSFQGRLRMRTITEIGGVLVPAPGVVNFTLEFGENLSSNWKVVINSIARPVVQPALPLTQ
jgi:hypothetical protein